MAGGGGEGRGREHWVRAWSQHKQSRAKQSCTNAQTLTHTITNTHSNTDTVQYMHPAHKHPRRAGGLSVGLTIAVGEVDVALGASLAVLSGVVGLAVAAAGHILTRAICEFRLAGALCEQAKQKCCMFITYS